MLSRFFPLLLLTTSVIAQPTVTGNVQSTDGQSLAYAHVLLLNAKDSSLAKGAVTDPSGVYTFEQLRPGRYQVLVSMIGYQTTYSPLFSLSGTGG